MLALALSFALSAGSPPTTIFLVQYGPKEAGQVFLSCNGDEQLDCSMNRVTVVKTDIGCEVKTHETKAIVVFKKISPGTWVRTLGGVFCAHLMDTWTLRQGTDGRWLLSYRTARLREPEGDLERRCSPMEPRDFSEWRKGSPGVDMDCKHILMVP